MKPPVFVLVHGINDTSRKLRTMQAAIESKGYRCIVPSLTPKNASKGLEFLAGQLAGVINAETEGLDATLCLVGFSMGGLVSRFYLQELEGYRKVGLFFTIAAPHHGSLMAYFSASIGAKQMRPNSRFLRSLESSASRLNSTPCYSYWTPFDLMILPATSSVWDKAENIKIYSLCHPFMVRHKEIIADMLTKVESTFEKPT